VYERVVRKKRARVVVRRVGALALAVAVVAGTATGSYALIRTFTGRRTEPASHPVPSNGLIAFTRGDGSIYVASPEGGRGQRITDPSLRAAWPAWSPDGTTIAFDGGRGAEHGIYLMQADGSDVRLLVRTHRSYTQPAWTREGRSLLYVDDAIVPGATKRRVFLRSLNMDTGRMRTIMNAGRCNFDHPTAGPNGTVAIIIEACSGGPTLGGVLGVVAVRARDGRVTRLESTRGHLSGLDWSPDGSTLAFSRDGIDTVSPDRSGYRHVADIGAVDLRYSPDGTKFIFQQASLRAKPIAIMNADGTDVHVALLDAAQEPSWQPVPADAPSTGPVPSSKPSLAKPVATTPPPSSTDPHEAAPGCDSSALGADFDGDGKQDTATVHADRCSGPGEDWTIDVRWGSGASGAWSLSECAEACAATTWIPLPDGSLAVALRTKEEAGLFAYELLSVYPGEIGPQAYAVGPAGSQEFPSGSTIELTDGGSVPHRAFLRCRGGSYGGGGGETAIETTADRSSDGSSVRLIQTVLAQSAGATQPTMTVMSRDERTVPAQSFDPSKDLAGVPCWAR
jgi:hypothetical protein